MHAMTRRDFGFGMLGATLAGIGAAAGATSPASAAARTPVSLDALRHAD